MTERESERRRRFDDLFSAYSADIVAYCGWRAGPSGDAQDAVADVFMTAWRRLDELPEGDAARVWLYATARKVLANQRRSNRRRAALHERLARETLVPPQPPVPGREESLVRDALGSLGPRDHEVPAAGGVGRSHARRDRRRPRRAHGYRPGTAAPCPATIRWNGGDLDVARETPNRTGRPGSELRVVDGTLYGIDVDGGWIVLGSPDSIDPGSGTTPDEYLAAVREDVGGVTLRRITRGMTGLTTGQLADGATVYEGRVAAGLVARESGFEEGQAIRVLPFGYVAHDEAANPAALLDVAVTVGADGIVRGIDVTWGSWTYTVTYRNLGATAALVAPENAKPFPDRSLPRRSVSGSGG